MSIGNTNAVCVDFDGTICNGGPWQGLDHFGPPFDGARDFLAQLWSLGYEVVIYSGRTNPDVCGGDAESLARPIEAWLKEHALFYSRVYVGRGKPDACAFIDDKAIRCRPVEDASAAYATALDGLARLRRAEWNC